MNETPLTDTDRRVLLGVASDSIAHGLTHHEPLRVDPKRYSAVLQLSRATFVTLTIAGRLRGCIGTLTAIRALVVDVAHNAFAAAFRDPRFTPVNIAEQALLETHISILSPPEPMTFTDEADLLAQIRPKIDGLILEDGHHRGTFLPSVWETLPQTQTFWTHLKAKAGLPAHHWSKTLKVSRYTAMSVH